MAGTVLIHGVHYCVIHHWKPEVLNILIGWKCDMMYINILIINGKIHLHNMTHIKQFPENHYNRMEPFVMGRNPEKMDCGPYTVS